MTFFLPKPLKTLALGLLTALALAPSAHAFVTFNLGGTAGNASSYTYTQPGAPTLTVTGSSGDDVNRSSSGLGVDVGGLDNTSVDDDEFLVLTFASKAYLYGWVTQDTVDLSLIFDAPLRNTFELLVDGVSQGDFAIGDQPILLTPFVGKIFTFKSNDDSFRLNAVTVPEPESLALVLAGLAVVGFVGARRKQAA